MLRPVSHSGSSSGYTSEGAAPQSRILDMITDPYNQESDVFVTSIKPSPKNIPDFSKTSGRKLKWLVREQDKEGEECTLHQLQ